MITYKTGIVPPARTIAALYDNAGLNRPTSDLGRIAKMYENSNLVISAWDGETLAGICRSLTDFSYCCYLSDLAVAEEYKRSGIGKKLIALTREALGPQVTLILLSAPGAMEYYPKAGFEKIGNGFIIHREL